VRKENGKLSTWKIVWKTAVLLLLLLMTSCVGLYLLAPDVEHLKKKNPKSTSFIEIRNGERAKRGLAKVRINTWVRYSAFPDHLVQAVRIAEDDRFFQHNGFDLKQLWEALKDKISGGKRLRGASTITQQLAKNLFLSGSRSIIRKALEIPIAIKLERELSKKRIFEIYLNVIEFGDGIFGIETAANYYFRKHTWQLSVNEAIFLAALIKRPIYFQKHQDSRSFLFRQDLILERMAIYGYIE